MKARIGILGSLLGLLATSGCYHYIPVRIEDPVPGEEVQLRLSIEQAARFNQELGTVGRNIRGLLIERPDEALLIETLIPRAQGRIYQRVNVPLSGVLEVGTKELSQFRTWATVGGLVAVATTVIVIQFIQGSDQQEDSGDGGVDNIRVPIFGIRW